MKPLALDKIRIDGGTQPRCEIDESLVAEYAEAMEADAEFPPVVVFVDGAEHWLADGFHRYHAARRVGLTPLPAELRPGTLRDAILWSVGANAAHGKRRTNADKRKALLVLLGDEEWAKWSNVEIARRCGVSDMTVKRVRDETSLQQSGSDTRTYTTRHGTEATMDTTKIGKGAKRGSAERAAAVAAIESLGPEASVREIADAAGVATSTAVRARKDLGLDDAGGVQVRRQAAYGRVAAFIGGALEGASEGMQSIAEVRGKLPSQLSYALEVADAEEVGRWIDVLGRLIGASRALHKALKEAI